MGSSILSYPNANRPRVYKRSSCAAPADRSHGEKCGVIIVIIIIVVIVIVIVIIILIIIIRSGTSEIRMRSCARSTDRNSSQW